MIHLLNVDEVESAVEDLSIGDVVVVCDADGERAATVARRVTRWRTAVFVGDLSTDRDRMAAHEFAAETFYSDGPIVIGSDRPGSN